MRRAGSFASPVPKGAAASSSAAAATPAKAPRIPLPDPTGNERVDEDRKGKHTLLCQIVDGCMVNWDLVVPMFNKYTELTEKEAKTVAIEEAQKFSKIPTVIRSIDEDWVMQYIASESGWDIQWLVAAKKRDPDVIWQLMECHTQLNPMMRVPASFQIKHVAKSAFDARAALFGHPLQVLKEKNCLGRSGALTWKAPVCKCAFRGKALHTIMHIRTGLTVEANNTHISSDWKLDYQWSESRAQFVNPPFPGIQQNMFFEKGTGPHSVAHFGIRSKSWQADVNTIMEKWEEEKDTVAGASGAGQVAKEALNDMKKEKAKRTMGEARAAGKERLAERKRARQAKFNE